MRTQEWLDGRRSRAEAALNPGGPYAALDAVTEDMTSLEHAAHELARCLGTLQLEHYEQIVNKTRRTLDDECDRLTHEALRTLPGRPRAGAVADVRVSSGQRRFSPAVRLATILLALSWAMDPPDESEPSAMY